MIDRAIPLPIAQPCRLLDVNRSRFYYRPAAPSQVDLELMRLIDELHLPRPFLGRRRLRDEVEHKLGQPVNRKRVQRLMVLMGIHAPISSATPAGRGRVTPGTPPDSRAWPSSGPTR